MSKEAPDYAILWGLLSQDEYDFLETVGVELLPSTIRFTRSPTWDEYTLIFAYLYALKRRTRQEGNHIGFAVGDCLIAGNQFFGEGKIDQWLNEYIRLDAMRDMILNMAGATLILLQEVEESVKLYCAAVAPKGLNLTIQDLFSTDPSRRKHTLGQLARALKDTQLFDLAFEDRLTRFVAQRNDFAYNQWVEKRSIYATTSELPSLSELEEIYQFIQSLITEANYIHGVFRSYRYHLISAFAPRKEEESALPLRWWGKYIAEFREVLRSRKDVI